MLVNLTIETGIKDPENPGRDILLDLQDDIPELIGIRYHSPKNYTWYYRKHYGFDGYKIKAA